MKKLLLFIMSLLLLSGCEDFGPNKYELKKADNKLIRLNKKTGEMIVLNGNNILKIDDHYIKSKTKEIEDLHKPIFFNKRAFPESKGLMKTNLALKWIDNKILYQYIIYPYDEDIYQSFKKGSDSLTIQFIDIDGFEIKSATVTLSALIRSVDDAGTPNAWSYDGSLSCDQELFQLIKDVSPQWRFSKELRSSIRKHATRLEKELKNLNDKLTSLINDGEIVGVIKGNGDYSIKNTYGKDIDVAKDNLTYIKYIVNHKEEFKFIEPDKESLLNSSSNQ